jgi:hypothetical protein
MSLFDLFAFGSEPFYDAWVRAANGAIFVICCTLTFYFGRALLEDRRDFGRKWLMLNSVRHTYAKFIIFLFGGLARGWAVTVLKLRDWGYDTRWVEQHIPVHMVSAVGFVIGGLILVRLWSRTNLGWMASLAWTVVFAVLTVVL